MISIDSDGGPRDETGEDDMQRLMFFVMVWAIGSIACDTDDPADGTPARVDREVQDGADVDQVTFEVLGTPVSIAKLTNGPAPALPEGAMESTVAFEGQEIFAIELPGQDPPIVLLHGLPDNLYLYDRLYPELTGRHVIAFDFVGWGRSSKPLPGDYEYSTAQQQRELAAVLESFSVQQAVLVAHDSSGPPAIDYVRETPDRVAHLVLLNTFYGFAQGNLRPPKGVELHSDPQLDAAEAAVQQDPAAIEAYYRFQMNEFVVSAPDEETFIDELWALYKEARPAFVALTNRLPLEVGPRSPVEAEQLSQLNLPVEIIFGVVDPYLNPAVARHFEASIPQANLTLIENAGHFVQADAPAVVAARILALE